MAHVATSRCWSIGISTHLADMQDFKRLQVWHKAHACFLAFYRAFAPDSTKRISGFRAQVIRAALSIPANIAEGCGKRTTPEMLRFVDISIGSSRELENHLIVARDLEVVSQPQYSSLDEQLTEVRRMLLGLSGALRRQLPRDAPPASD